MLTVLNNYTHGLVAIPVINAVRKQSLIRYIQERQPCHLDDLCKSFSANKGHLLTALSLLESLSFIQGVRDDYIIVHPDYESYDPFEGFPADLGILINFDFDSYLQQTDTTSISLALWIEQLRNRWGLGKTLAMYMDGCLLVPLLLSMKKHEMLDIKEQSLSFMDSDFPLKNELIDIFLDRQWLEYNTSGQLKITGTGEFVAKRIFICASVASYLPMLRNIEQVIFGDCQKVFGRDHYGHEKHIDRSLNVLGSGFQHQRYFSDMEASICQIFNQPLDQQPRYIADMGCGDGQLLKKLFDVILEKTLRGQHIDRYPLQLLGVDYNEKALDETKKTLHGLDFRTLKGDIGDPAQMIKDLATIGIDDPENILHVRSFLDHDRPWINPQQTRQHYANISYSIATHSDGNAIDPVDAWQSLFEHLQRWGAIPSKFGLLMLEVHSLPSNIIANFCAQTESLHFDAYHRFSSQLLVDAADFVAAAAQAKLIPNIELSQSYPRINPFSRITLNYFKHQPWSFRIAAINDLTVLENLEYAKVDTDQPYTFNFQAAIARRIDSFPKGQWVAELDGQIVAVVYSQRILCEGQQQEIENSRQQSLWCHNDQGEMAQLLSVELVPVQGVSADLVQTAAKGLVSFVNYYLSLCSGVEEVLGMDYCLNTLDQASKESIHNNLITGDDLLVDDNVANKTMAGQVDHKLRQFINASNLIAVDDDKHPESMLHDFCLSWLIKNFNTLGVFSNEIHGYQSVNEIIQQARVIPKYQQLMSALINMLYTRGVIDKAQGKFCKNQRYIEKTLPDFEQDKERFILNFKRQFPDYLDYTRFIFPCLEHMPALLQGEVMITDVMFTDGDMSAFASIFRNNPVADYFNQLAAEAIATYVDELSCNNSADRTIRILEIGAGTGGATANILSALTPHHQHIDYCYSDLSGAFTRYGEKHFGNDYSCMRFERFDIEKAIESQGFSQQSFDVIYAGNVLHDTHYIIDTLANVKALLKPGGLMVLNEFTSVKDFLVYTGGFLHGIWLYKDPEYRLHNFPCISPQKWQ